MGKGKAAAAILLAAVLTFDLRTLGTYFREGRADWRPLALFLSNRPAGQWVFTENAYSALCLAFYV